MGCGVQLVVQTPDSPPTPSAGPDCALRTDQETEAWRGGFGDLLGVKHGLKEEEAKIQTLGLARGSQCSEVPTGTACVGTHIHTVLCSGSGPEKTRFIKEGPKDFRGVCMCAYTKHPVVSASEGCVCGFRWRGSSV